MTHQAINLVEALAAHAKDRPSAPAIVDGERIVAYRELHPLVAGMAARLRRAGLGEGDFVGVSLDDSIEHLVVLHALAWIGAIIVSLPPSLPQAERSRLASGFGVTAIVGADDAAALEGLPLIRIDPGWQAAAGDAPLAPAPVSGADRPLMLITTSGTTSLPRGIVISHAQMLARLSAIVASFGIVADDRYLSVVSMNVNVGRIYCLTALQRGAAVVIHRDLKSIADALAAIARNRITWTFLVPQQLRRLLTLVGQSGMLFPAVRLLNVASGLLRPEERAAARDRLTPSFVENYGANEVGLLAVSTPDHQIAHPDSVGRVIAGLEAEVVDEHHRPVPRGTVGRIRFRSPSFPQGYYRDPEATARSFRDGWFYPGDLAAIDLDGNVYLKGRGDDLINHAGLKVYPSEIEACLLAHPAVAEAAVIGAPAPEVQELPFAFVVAKGPASERDLVDFCRQRLAVHKVPHRVFITRQLPKNDAGKVLKQVLRDSLDRARITPKPD